MKHTGIVIALLPEATCLTPSPVVNNIIELTDRISMYISGMGSERITKGVQVLLDSGVDSLISFGTAGALQPDFIPGVVVVPKKIIGRDMETYDMTADWHARVMKNLADAPMSIHTGNLVHSDSVLSTSKDKSLLHNKCGAVAVDMESAVIAAMAIGKGVPVLAIRAVVDDAAMSIAGSVLNHSDIYGNMNIAGLLFSLLKHPGDIPDFIRLVKGFRSASANLSWLGRHLEKILLSI